MIASRAADSAYAWLQKNPNTDGSKVSKNTSRLSCNKFLILDSCILGAGGLSFLPDPLTLFPTQYVSTVGSLVQLAAFPHDRPCKACSEVRYYVAPNCH